MQAGARRYWTILLGAKEEDGEGRAGRNRTLARGVTGNSACLPHICAWGPGF